MTYRPVPVSFTQARTDQPVDWVAEGQRPAGQPGEVGGRYGAAFVYPAVTDPTGRVWHWRDTDTTAGRWIATTRRLAATFVPGPEWQASCDHAGPVPWRGCDTEAECITRAKEGR